MNIPFDQLKEDSRIWIFQANRHLTDKEKDHLADRMQAFTAQWAAHGKSLKSAFILLNNIHLIIGVDISVNDASGCSIDALVHQVEKAGSDLNVNFFDRKTVAYELNGKTEVLSFEDLKGSIEKGTLKPDSVTFNNIITSKGEIKSKWRVKAANSWIKRYFSNTTFTTT